jgi:CheY-like chemotaxis protein
LESQLLAGTLAIDVRGSIGQILLRQGVIDPDVLADALQRQSARHPVASVLYTLGYASERQLAMALAQQTGWPAIVLDESAFKLDSLGHISAEWARIFQALVIHEDDKSLVIAAARPEDAIVPARELATARGKRAELRIALDITLARTIRLAFRKWKSGEVFLVGPEVDRPGVFLSVVQPDGDDNEHRSAQRALAEDAARSIERDDELPSVERRALGGDWHVNTTTTATDLDRVPDSDDDPLEADRTMFLTAEIDRGEDPDERAGQMRALIVDPDPQGRIQLVADLEKIGYECQAAASGSQAIELLSQLSFDVMFADVATSDVDGLRLCRAVKRSRRLNRCRVVVTAAVVDSGQVPDDVLQRHGADGYLEKPLDSRRLHRLLHELTPRDRPGETDRNGDHEALVAEALARYHAGDVDTAIQKLRASLVGDPTSPKLHFMLANMLQRASRWAESVDEYEAVVDLQPAYFPALTRLAYLYYRQGLHARAVETWRRALPVCEDPALRQNIELFMRKLVADISRQDAG